jgi:acetylornithine deacetylase/succinyl-diaminopimelate desuccinylase-like protein
MEIIMPRFPTLLAVLGVAVATPLAAAPSAVAQQCPAAERRYCDELARLARDPAIRKAFSYLEAKDGEALKDLITLTEIEAPPFKEGKRAAKYAAMLREAGADSVHIDEAGNVIALRRGKVGGRVVAIAGHLDTVFPEGTDVTVTQRGDTLFAPGIGDDSRGLVVVLHALKAMQEAGIRTDADLLFVGTVGEEGLGDLRGVKHLFRQGGPKIDAFIAVDGGDDTRIVTQGLGSKRYRVTFKGPGGHSWGAFGAANPVHALGRAVRLFDDAAAKYTASAAAPTSYNVGRIGGGTSVNSIPFEAWMEVDMRSEEQGSLLKIDSIFRASVQQALAEQNQQTRRGARMTVDMELVGDRPSGKTAADAPLLLRTMAATRHFGDVPALESSSTDANIPIALGIPAVTITRGGIGGRAHSPDEWWINRRGPVAIQRALLLLVAEAGVGGAAKAKR